MTITRTIAIAVILALLAGPLTLVWVTAQAEDEPALGPRVEELLDRADKLRRAIARGRDRIARGEVETVMIRVPFMDDKLISMAEAEALAAQLEQEAQDIFREACEEQASIHDRAQRLVSSIKDIQVPPPIPPEEASIVFGDLAEGDYKSALVLLGMDLGIAVLDTAGKIGGRVMPPLRIIVLAGKTFIAAEEGADVYLTKKTETYEKALTFLKDPASAREFTAIVRAIKEGRPLPATASLDMVRAAQAITSPELGGSTSRIMWTAFMSKEARNAALTQASLEAYGWVTGDVTEHTVKRIFVQRSARYRKAAKRLDRAGRLMKKAKKPATRAKLQQGIDHANRVMAKSFSTYSAQSKGAAYLNTFYRSARFQEALKKHAARKRQ